jgi:hypothetical protein
VSYVLPDVFEERIVRLYCNTKSQGKDEIVEKIIKAFGKWCQEKNYPLPQVGVQKNTHVLFSFKRGHSKIITIFNIEKYGFVPLVSVYFMTN